MSLQDAADIILIQRVIARYNHCGDAADPEGVAAVFTPDATLEIPGQVFTGIDAVRGFYEGRREMGLQEIREKRRYRHYLTNHLIEITGPGAAAGKTYFMLVRNGRIEQQGTYVDTFRKVGDDWLIASRNVVMHWME